MNDSYLDFYTLRKFRKRESNLSPATCRTRYTTPAAMFSGLETQQLRRYISQRSTCVHNGAPNICLSEPSGGPNSLGAPDAIQLKKWWSLICGWVKCRRQQRTCKNTVIWYESQQRASAIAVIMNLSVYWMSLRAVCWCLLWEFYCQISFLQHW